MAESRSRIGLAGRVGRPRARPIYRSGSRIRRRGAAVSREDDVRHARQGPLRSLATLYLALGLVTSPASQIVADGPFADATGDAAASLKPADMPILRWSPEQRVSLTGVPISLWTFETSASLMSTVRSLASKIDYFQRVLVQGNVLVLSGLSKDRHWLAELRSTGEGTSGRISALSHEAYLPQPHAQASTDATRPYWHPPWSTLIFSLEALEPGEPSLSLLRISGSVRTVRRKMAAYLLENHWLAAQSTAVPDTWISGHAQLRLYFDCADDCTVLGYLSPSIEQ